MPRKRKHSSEEDDEEEPEDVENGVRAKRRAAIAARDRVAANDEGASDDDEDKDNDEGEDDEDDEDYEGEEGDEDEADSDQDGDEDEDEAGDGKLRPKEGDDEDDEEEDDDGDAEPVDCIEAILEEPTKDTPGYVLRKKEDALQKLELCFAGEMRDTLEDINEVFYTSFESKKIPVLQVQKYDVIEESDEIYQVDVLEAKFDKAYDLRELDEKENKNILSQNFYSIVKVDGVDKTWATQYFMPEE